MEKVVVGGKGGGRRGQYIFDIRSRNKPFLCNIKVYRQQASYCLHDRHALLLAEPAPFEILDEGKRVEMMHVRRRVEMRRFVLFRFLDRRRTHLEDRFEWFGGAGFVVAEGFGGRLFGVGFGGVEFAGAGGGVAHRGCNGGVAGTICFVFARVFEF